jgi:YggT family protein
MSRFFLLSLIDNLTYCYVLLLMVRIISSWFYELQSSSIIGMVRVATDPYLNFFRKIIPPIGMLDISPIVAFFSLQVGASIIKSIIIAS